jgi:hypothetical protein
MFVLQQVCGGTVKTELGDMDSRQGWIETTITWGPNSVDGKINELSIGILGYSVFATNECGEKIGNDLATVSALGIQSGTQPCCNTNMYEATVRSQLPYGVTKQAFMVVPLTSIGALDVGWATSEIVDGVWVGGPTPTNAPSPSPQLRTNAPSPGVTTASGPSPSDYYYDYVQNQNQVVTNTTATAHTGSSSSSTTSYSSVLLFLVLLVTSKGM